MATAVRDFCRNILYIICIIFTIAKITMNEHYKSIKYNNKVINESEGLRNENHKQFDSTDFTLCTVSKIERGRK